MRVVNAPAGFFFAETPKKTVSFFRELCYTNIGYCLKSYLVHVMAQGGFFMGLFSKFSKAGRGAVAAGDDGPSLID